MNRIGKKGIKADNLQLVKHLTEGIVLIASLVILALHSHHFLAAVKIIIIA